MFFFFKTVFSFLEMFPDAASGETFRSKRFETGALANRLISVRGNVPGTGHALEKTWNIFSAFRRGGNFGIERYARKNSLSVFHRRGACEKNGEGDARFSRMDFLQFADCGAGCVEISAFFCYTVRKRRGNSCGRFLRDRCWALRRARRSL